MRRTIVHDAHLCRRDTLVKLRFTSPFCNVAVLTYWLMFNGTTIAPRFDRKAIDPEMTKTWKANFLTGVAFLDRWAPGRRRDPFGERPRELRLVAGVPSPGNHVRDGLERRA